MAPAAIVTMCDDFREPQGYGTLVSMSRSSTLDSFDTDSLSEPRPGRLSRTSTGDLLVSEKILAAAVGNRYSGVGVLQTLLRHRSHITVSEKIIVAAAANTREGAALIKLLLAHGNVDVGLSEEVMQSAARNQGQGPEVMEALLEHLKQHHTNLGEDDDEDTRMKMAISDKVLQLAAANEDKGPEVMAVLLRYGKDFGLQVSDSVMEAAAANEDRGPQVMEVLLKHLDLHQL
jgi:hypothetical protein